MLLDEEDEKVPEGVLPGRPNVLGAIGEPFDLGRVQVVLGVRRLPDGDASVEERRWRRRRFCQHRQLVDVIRFLLGPDLPLVGDVLPLLAKPSFRVAVAGDLKKTQA